MARVTLSKSALQRESAALARYQRYLPALDLKRRQLIAERAKATRRLTQTHAESETLNTMIASELAMLANEDVDLNELVTVQGVALETQNVMGTDLPVLRNVDIQVRNYSFLAKPHWVDAVAAHLQTMLELRVRVQVEQRRLGLLETAVRRVTQRVNLFDKVLIPRTRDNMKRIKVYLADNERAGVVRAKLAKAKRVRDARPREAGM